MDRGNLSSEIKSTVRRRIVMHSGDKDLVIYEGKLATEFGVSRTPVRQVIQSLASESLVEVRSGVGTIAKPLSEDRRIKDMTSFASILRACSECTLSGNVNLALSEIEALRIYAERANTDAPDEMFFDVSSRLINCLSNLVEDTILRDALIACYWRYTRRRVVEHQGNYLVVIQEFIQLVKDAEHGAQSGDAQQVMQMVSGNVEDTIKSAS